MRAITRHVALVALAFVVAAHVVFVATPSAEARSGGYVFVQDDSNTESDGRPGDFEINPDREPDGDGQSPSEDGTAESRRDEPDVIDPESRTPGCRLRDGKPLDLLV